jgi:hypothetical protein
MHIDMFRVEEAEGRKGTSSTKTAVQKMTQSSKREQLSKGLEWSRTKDILEEVQRHFQSGTMPEGYTSTMEYRWGFGVPSGAKSESCPGYSGEDQESGSEKSRTPNCSVRDGRPVSDSRPTAKTTDKDNTLA